MIDVFTKYARIKLLKDKKGKTVINAFTEVVNECKTVINAFIEIVNKSNESMG